MAELFNEDLGSHDRRIYAQLTRTGVLIELPFLAHLPGLPVGACANAATHRVTAWRWDGKRGRLMSTMPMSASDTRLYGHDTFVAEVVDHLDVLYRVALRLTRRPQINLEDE